MTNHELSLCEHDAVATLRLIVAKKGAPIHVSQLPLCFTSGLWIEEQRFFTYSVLTGTTFRFFITRKGLEFLRAHGVTVEPKDLAMPNYLRNAPAFEEVEFDHVYVQYGAAGIREFWNLATLPEFVIDTLKAGMLAVHDGGLYGLSEAHILSL